MSFGMRPIPGRLAHCLGLQAVLAWIRCAMIADWSDTVTHRWYRCSMLPYNLDHVAIAVENLDIAIDGYRTLFNIEVLYREVVADQGVEEAMLAVGGSCVQLLAPLNPDTPVGKFLATRGEGLHHLAFAVPDIIAALEHLKELDAELIDETPRIGGRGARIAFVHPRELTGTLIELVEVSGE